LIRLSGLADIAGTYDGFIIDLWGVIHDGVQPYPGALDCLARLQDYPVLLLSNAPRRAHAARTMLRRMGIGDALYTSILTSGEAVWLALRERTDAWFAALGTRAFLLGPERDRNILAELALTVAETPEAAEFVVNTGPDDASDPTTLEPFLPILERCRSAGLPMICANPDLEVIRGGVRILCAGALAEHYAMSGGDVRSIGKPLPEIYDMAFQYLGLERRRVLAIGDSLRTDIAGAAAAGVDALWVLGGIHGEALAGDDGRAAAAAEAAGLSPLAWMPNLIWR
jgi:HAD superfamily hydrolase (TIGR01459 family)